MKSRLALAALFIAPCAFASPIGLVGIGSTGVVQATLTSILFTPDPSAIGACPGNPCNGDVNTGTTLIFAGGPLGIGEGILINGGNPFGTPPPAGAGVFNPFLQFAAHPGLTFDFTGIDFGGGPPPSSDCVAASVGTGGSCAIDVAGTQSPVVLTKLGTSTLVSIGLLGTATDGTGISDWSGAFSATIPSITPEGILLQFCPSGTCTAADVAAGRMLIVRSVSGSLDVRASGVPEPGTLSMLFAGAGFVAIGLVRRKRGVAKV